MNSWTLGTINFHSYTLCLDRGGNASVTYSGKGNLDVKKDAGHHQAHAHTHWGAINSGQSIVNTLWETEGTPATATRIRRVHAKLTH